MCVALSLICAVLCLVVGNWLASVAWISVFCSSMVIRDLENLNENKCKNANVRQ